MLSKVSGTEDRGPYAYNIRSGLWVGYDDIDSAGQKASYVLKNGFGGVAIWTLDFDDFNNICCKGPSPILRAASLVLRGQTNNVASINNCQKPPAVATPSPPKFDPWDDGTQG